MKTLKSLSQLCEDVLKGKELSSPKNDEVGKLPDDLFGEVPDLDEEGPEKAKVKEGPSYKITSGSLTKTSTSKKFKGTEPAEEPEMESPEDTEEQEDAFPKKMKKQLNDNLTMSAFETLFKKTITEDLGEETEPQMEQDEAAEEAAPEVEEAEESEETEEADETDEDGDLISDLKALQQQIGNIIDRLSSQAEEEEEESPENEYSPEEFDEEFGEEEEEEEEEGEEAPVKESKMSSSKMKLLSNEAGKKMAKKGMNKVGKLQPKKSKNYSGSVKTQAKPAMVPNKKGQTLQKGADVKTKHSEGDSFFE